MDDVSTTSAVAAAIEVGRGLALPAGEREVLAARSNVLVRLGPAVARVPATWRFRHSSRSGAHRSFHRWKTQVRTSRAGYR
ncbi:MAG TPA: hypothetical protein VJ870_17435 [Amycolatopsis sp.]|nr:hypothetical protein [Amycolatopsis sp.]